MGVSLALTERSSISGSWELGTLIDRETQAETDRRAGGVNFGYLPPERRARVPEFFAWFGDRLPAEPSAAAEPALQRAR